MSKWIMNREMHLGFIRQTLGKGAVIEHDEDKNVLVVDGMTYDVVKDLTILRKHGLVSPYDEAAAEQTKQEANTESEARDARIREHKGQTEQESQKMEVVRDDSDDHPVIDISHTKKQKSLPREINNEMEIVKGDEDPSERQANADTLKAEQKEEKPHKMPIVRDDSLGNVVSEAPTLNKGQQVKTSSEKMPVVKDDSLGTNVGEKSLNQTVSPKTLSAEEHEKIRQENLKKAQSGFVDDRIKQALDAANSINKDDTGTVEVKSETELTDVETPKAVAKPEVEATNTEQGEESTNNSETQGEESDLVNGLDLSKL